MAIIRVDICTENGCVFNKVFTDEQTAIRETDEFLFAHKLNDGCSLSSKEDFISLNAILAEMFDDPYNAENFAEWHEIDSEVAKAIENHLQNEIVSSEQWVEIAEILEIDLKEIYEQ
jgi:hypothetical protein